MLTLSEGQASNRVTPRPQDDIRKKIVEGRRRAKEAARQSKEDEETEIENLSSTDWCIICGAPSVCAVILLGEPEIDVVVLGLMLVIDVLFFFTVYAPGKLERFSYILSNIVILLSGDKVRELYLLPQALTPLQWVLLLSYNAISLLSFWYVWIRTVTKRSERIQRWDIALVLLALSNTALAVLFGGVSIHQIMYRMAFLKKLVGM